MYIELCILHSAARFKSDSSVKITFLFHCAPHPMFDKDNASVAVCIAVLENFELKALSCMPSCDRLFIKHSRPTWRDRDI